MRNTKSPISRRAFCIGTLDMPPVVSQDPNT